MLRELFQRWIGHYPTYGIMLPSTDRAGMPSVTPLTALYYTPVYRACSPDRAGHGARRHRDLEHDARDAASGSRTAT
jgi:hypothetical protein